MKEIRKPGGPKNERGKCSMFIKGARNGPDSKRRWDGVAEWTACIVTSPGYVPVSFLCVFQICLEFVVWQYIWLGLVGRGKLQRKNIREALKIQSFNSVIKIQLQNSVEKPYKIQLKNPIKQVWNNTTQVWKFSCLLSIIVVRTAHAQLLPLQSKLPPTPLCTTREVTN